MHTAQSHLYSRSTNMYICRALISIAFVIVFFYSHSSYALAPNLGATCPANYVQGSFTNSDYNNLVASKDNNTYFDVAGNASGIIPLQMKMSVTESSIYNDNRNFSVINNSINIGRDFFTRSEYTDIKLDFRNNATSQPIYLTNVAMSAFDIDYGNFDDYVQITGVVQNGTTIEGTLQKIDGSNIVYDQGLYISNTSNCPDRELSTACQGSIQFSAPVSTVLIRYTNTRYSDFYPSTQEIDLRLDSYCYLPPQPSYNITKDDGITSIGSGNTTTYTIKVTNTGGSTLSNIVLKDPVVSGLSKESGISCDTADASNACTAPPTATQLESSAGFTLPSLPVGKSYSIKVPTRVTTAAGGNVTNTATISHSTLASKSAADTNSVSSAFDGGSTLTPASCPANHRMYYVGASAPSTPYRSIPLSGWTAGSRSKVYTFNEGSTFTINFTSVLDIDTTYSPVPPFYGDIPNAIQNAINLVHNSPSAKTNHVLNVTVNKPVSKLGYVIQDLDSTSVNNQVPYQEQVDVSGSAGSLTYNQTYHTINPANNIVTSIRGLNCSTVGACPINATWGYKAANNPFSLSHTNVFRETNGAHAVGYSDFYFCLAPPKVVVTKALTGTRVNDTASNRDQFTVSVSSGSTTLSSFETAGSGQTISNGRSGAISLAENTSYTIIEKVTNSTNGDIANYSASYTCTNSTTGSTTVMPTAAMTYNATAKTRSFTLANTRYGDEITCIITNTPNNYTFSGTVFNDNGGITGSNASATNANITTGPYANNSNYFNGIFDPTQETGVTGSTVKLVNCATPSTVYATQAVSATGFYQISASATTINSNLNNICLVEERSGDDYPIRTNNASKTITILANTYNYANNDFGRVIAENVALVLTKYQYINSCPTTLDYSNIGETATPSTGFSTASIDKIDPGKCIAYKITATNRANTDINNFVMEDILQKNGVNNATTTSVLANPALDPADYDSSSPAVGQNGIVKTQSFVLPSRSKRDFYFNTKYGTIVNAQ